MSWLAGKMSAGYRTECKKGHPLPPFDGRKRTCRACVEERLLERYWSKVDKTGECWNWTASVYKDTGYGVFVVGGRTPTIFTAHRFAYERFVGPVGDFFVCHYCDNRRCQRTEPSELYPEGHLFLGAVADNQADMAKKDRSTHGIKNPQAKLHDEAVREIRRRVDQREGTKRQVMLVLAAELGVTEETVRKAYLGESWWRV
jgi:hypothetical protein